MDKSSSNAFKNKKSFEKLFFEYYEPLCRRVYTILRDEDITKDIVQDVFVKVWNKRDEIMLTESVGAYLYRSCLNEALNYLKQSDRRSNREEIYMSGVVKNTDSPESKIFEKETGEKIDSILSSLPPTCKEVFLLSRYEEMSYKEIANFLKISVNTVEKHIGKALRIFRQKLKSE